MEINSTVGSIKVNRFPIFRILGLGCCQHHLVLNITDRINACYAIREACIPLEAVVLSCK